jgi:hypothetical protein
MRPPITEQPDSTILARVAIQLVKRSLLSPLSEGYSPSSLVYFTSAALPKDGFGMLRFALHSLAAHLAMGVSSRDWLLHTSYRASQGGVFRWHFFAQYKSNRNPYPRVTNRGVQTSLPLATHNQRGDKLYD